MIAAIYGPCLAPSVKIYKMLEEIPQDVLAMSTEAVIDLTRLMETDIRVMKSELLRLQHEQTSMNEQLQDNLEKIKLNKQLPYLVSNVVELLDVDPDEEQDEGSNMDVDGARKGKCAVVKTSTRTVLGQHLIV